MGLSSFDLRDFFVGKTKVGSADVSFNLLLVASADDGASYGGISQRPRDRDLSWRTSMLLTNFTQAFNQSEIFRELRLLKLDVATAPIAVRETCCSFARHRAGQQAGCHRRIDNHAKLVRSTIRQNLLFDLATN